MKEIILQERHWDKLETDAADNVWAIFGQAVHAILEKSCADYTFQEEKFSVSVGNSTVTGIVDLYDMEHSLLVDWKTASVYKVMYRDFSDWYNQGMTYAWIMRQSGLDVKKITFIAMLKDHSKSKAKFDKTYPQSPVYVYEFDVTTEELEHEGARIKAKVAAIEAADKLPDDDIVPCTAEERWCNGDKYAVMRNGRKTAVRVFDTLLDAENCAGELGNSHYVEHRPAVSRKCADYCLCKDFCDFHKAQEGAE